MRRSPTTTWCSHHHASVKYYFSVCVFECNFIFSLAVTASTTVCSIRKPPNLVLCALIGYSLLRILTVVDHVQYMIHLRRVNSWLIRCDRMYGAALIAMASRRLWMCAPFVLFECVVAHPIAGYLLSTWTSIILLLVATHQNCLAQPSHTQTVE